MAGAFVVLDTADVEWSISEPYLYGRCKFLTKFKHVLLEKHMEISVVE